MRKGYKDGSAEGLPEATPKSGECMMSSDEEVVLCQMNMPNHDD
jgi:hypothetical protein